jgi:OOP family OmpA-OmpF porin
MENVMLPQENPMIPQEKPILLQKKPDDRYDTIIGVLLSLAMVAGVWHYALKPGTKHTFAKPPRLETVAAVVAPQVSAHPVVSETSIPTMSRPVVTEPQPPVLNPVPQEILATQPPRVVVHAAKSKVAPKPVIAAIKVKPKPVIKVPPPPVVVAAKPEVIKPVITAPPAPVIAPVAPKVIVRESIEFANGSAWLPPAATPRLLEIVELLKNDTRTLKIVGHTDNIGGVQANHILSLKRANAVRRFLVNSGVPAEHLTVEGAGSDNPIADNATEEGRKRNRRIEITEQP